MDKKYLIEQGLMDAHKQFKKLYEYTYFGGDELTNEDDEPNDAADIPNSDDMVDNMPQNDDMEQGNSMPDMDGNDIPSDGIPSDNAPMQDNNGVEGLDVDPNADSIDNDDVESEKEGDEVIDVDDLTKSQEDTEEKVDDLDDKFEKLLKAITNFEDIIDHNNEKIEDLKAEFERRNPTQIEKMSMQTQNSYPFNVTPKEYWDNKEQTSNYRTDYDDNGKEQGQYVITKDDVNNAVDWKSISNSLDDDEYHQNIKTIFGI